MVSSGAPSRNAPCPCGSGKKYKRCHGAPGDIGEGGAQPGVAAPLEPERDGPAAAGLAEHGRRFGGTRPRLAHVHPAPGDRARPPARRCAGLRDARHPRGPPRHGRHVLHDRLRLLRHGQRADVRRRPVSVEDLLTPIEEAQRGVPRGRRGAGGGPGRAAGRRLGTRRGGTFRRRVAPLQGQLGAGVRGQWKRSGWELVVEGWLQRGRGNQPNPGRTHAASPEPCVCLRLLPVGPEYFQPSIPAVNPCSPRSRSRGDR
ncbi:MAG: SEC-C domain-containing protein [Micromonosporaceae bacterium]|nr:SEC-C domain-containing protein [Micromonosporaceae bacterium]